MTFKEFLNFIDSENQRIIEYFGKSKSDRERVFGRTVKLMEEVGEFAGEVLANGGAQRKEKLDKMDSKNLEYEFADVIITAFLIAKSLKIDPQKAIKEKIEKIKKRKY